MTSTMIDPFGRSDEDRKAIQAEIEEINKVALANWTNPEWHRAMAAEMTETIYRGFTHENLLSLMSTVENLGFNDRSFVKEVRGMRAYWIARGGYIKASTVNEKVIEITRDVIGFHVYEFEEKIMVNFAETQANLIRLGIERLDAEVNARFLRSIQAAIPSSHDSYVGVTTLALSDLNTAITEVQDASRSPEVTIIGRAPAVQTIIDAIMGTSSNGAGYLPQTNEALLRTGLIGNYRGANIVKLVNWLDDTDTPYFPANELYVIAPDASKCAFFGGLRSKEWTNNDQDYWEYKAQRDFGMLIHRPDRLRRIVISSIPALTVGS